jgi:hypothetical protein
MKRSFILYHWSPVARRKQILKQGLCSRKPSTQSTWKAPYICFASSPSLAWALSAAMKTEIDEWDLWMVWSDRCGRLTRLGFSDWRTSEYRTRRARIPKRDLWFVGTRKQKRRKKRQ